MESEYNVTRILSTSEILDNKVINPYQANPIYDLSKFLNNIKNEPNKYGAKYRFVK